jgi:hypothetical protein
MRRESNGRSHPRTTNCSEYRYRLGSCLRLSYSDFAATSWTQCGDGEGLVGDAADLPGDVAGFTGGGVVFAGDADGFAVEVDGPVAEGDAPGVGAAFTSSNSTSKMRVELGGISRPALRSP